MPFRWLLIVVRRLFQATIIGVVLASITIVALLVVYEVRTSTLQASFLSRIASEAKFFIGPGGSPAIRFPKYGPYDERLGYVALPSFTDRLQAKGYEIAEQTRITSEMAELADYGLFLPYREKNQAGLSVFDCRGETLYSARFPERGYERFEEIPPLLVDSLLFIENRELLEAKSETRNPAVEWDRLGKAVADQLAHAVDEEHEAPGGSTLATQIEKYRHSLEGRTTNIKEKFRQMASGSVRAYMQGEDTRPVRRQLVLDYLNTVPLAAKPGFGEVNGIGDGLWAWYGRDFVELNRILKSNAGEGNGDLVAKAEAYKQALSLLISQRRPSYYLGSYTDDLEDLTNSYLRLLSVAGVIPADLRDAALAIRLQPKMNGTSLPPLSFVSRKAASTVRTHLASLLGTSRLYDLDRLDLSASSTLDARTQVAVTGVLRRLREPENTQAAGLRGSHLLDKGDPAKVIYSFTLYERSEGANYLRVQADNFDQPFDINEGTKLDLGSTAKLRTLVTYLEIVADLHKRFADKQVAELRKVEVSPKDHLTRWALDYLIGAKDKSLAPMIEAALDRKYSANPGEAFFTGGGLHTFVNFNRDDNSRIMPVRQAVRDSVNLVFVRLMRDIVHHFMFQTPGSSAQLLEDIDDPRRKGYLARFADREGRIFINRFFKKYQGKTADGAEELLLQGVHPTARRLSAIFRTIAPDAPLDQFSAFVNANLPTEDVDDKRLAQFYEEYSPQRMSLADRGYVATVHPLELWLVGFLRAHPGATQSQVLEASADERQEVYSWLFSTRRKHAQDKRILGLLEVEGFLEIHRHWKRLGYPFDSLVPSYATALGSSADRPAALAELMGILVNDGMRKPTVRLDELHFAADTPYETLLRHKGQEGERLLAPEIAIAVRKAIRGVVEEGTARRLKGTFVNPDGSPIAVGGKTGTGDHRFDVYGAHGQLIESRVVNRSATFVFYIGERFFGTVSAYVPGAQAANYDFTSALTVQLLKVLAPSLKPLLLSPPGDTAKPAQCAG